MTSIPSGNDILMRTGAPPSLDFGKIPPVRRGGQVLDGPTTYHCREYDASAPGGGPLRYFPDGNPIYGVWIDLLTTERDPYNREDDGRRRLYCEKPRMLTAIREAVIASGATTIELGGLLYVTFARTEQGKGGSPANVYTAEYTRPGNAHVMGQPSQPTLPARQAMQSLPPGTPQVARAVQTHPIPQSQPTQVPQPVAAQQVQQGTPVPADVYHAMRNAGMDVSAYVPMG